MSIAYKPRAEAAKLVITKGKTLRQLLSDNGLDGQLDTVGLYNWGTKAPTEINRALVELVGCAEVKLDPLDSVLDPALGTTRAVLKPEPWKAKGLAFEKVHTVKLKKRLPVTAVAITELTPWFDPASQTCSIKIRYEGAAARADKREYEIHATGYYDTRLDDQNVDEVDWPCGTDSLTEPTHTDLVRKARAAAPGTEDISWDGTSDATEGILKGAKKIHSRCAPYMVLVRYFKDNADKDARIQLDPFYPRWKLTGQARRELIPESLLVTWKVTGPTAAKNKLKRGQIAVHDKDGVVFIAPLTEGQIAGGKYDLLNGPVKWDKAKVDPKKLPYRIQIQAHSDEDEDSGLALAVMPTQVPAYAYERVQLIGFNVRNDTVGAAYLGGLTPQLDILRRARVMIEAIQLAHAGADADRKILKVFVAPEFYWRDQEGAYPISEISTILPALRAELDQEKYLDWMFVLGTAIGSLKHEETPAGTEHGAAIHRVKVVAVKSPTVVTVRFWTEPKKGWVFRKRGGAPATTIADDISGGGVFDTSDGSKKCDVTLATTAGFAIGDDAEMIEPVMTIGDTWPPIVSTKTQIRVSSTVCARIPTDSSGDVICIGGAPWKAVSEGITSNITKVVHHPNDGYFWLTLAPGGAYRSSKPLKLIEPVSTEVFNVGLIQKGWPAPHMKDGSLRELIVEKEKISPIDFIRSAPKSNWHKADGEHRKIKIHGAVDRPVLPTEGAVDLLGRNANTERKGSSAVGSEINASGLGGGTVFTMDGVTFGVEVCLDHAKDRLWGFYNGGNARAGDPQVQVQLIPSWGMSIGGSDPGKEVCALANGLVFNVDGSRMESVARVWDGVWSCDTHPTKTGAKNDKCDKPQSFKNDAGVEFFYCPNPAHAGTGFSGGGCPDGKKPCDEPLQQLGTAFLPSSTTDVPLSAAPRYFKKMGNVQVFPAKPLPDPDVVK